MTARPARLLLATLPLLTATGCLGWEEGMCSEGEQPLYALENATGAQCLPDGEPVPPGFATYPPDRVPEHVGDPYDRWPLAKDYPWADEVDPDVRREARLLRARDDGRDDGPG